jgi:hypothetical protein
METDLAQAMKEMVARQKGEAEASRKKTQEQADALKQKGEVRPVGGGGLLWNGQPVPPGALGGSYRNEAVQNPSGVPAELTRGHGPVRPEKAADDLSYDRGIGKWYRVVGGKRIYE